MDATELQGREGRWSVIRKEGRREGASLCRGWFTLQPTSKPVRKAPQVSQPRSPELITNRGGNKLLAPGDTGIGKGQYLVAVWSYSSRLTRLLSHCIFHGVWYSVNWSKISIFRPIIKCEIFFLSSFYSSRFEFDLLWLKEKGKASAFERNQIVLNVRVS